MEKKGTTDTLNFGEVQSRLSTPLAEFVRPSHAQTLCLWGEEGVYNHVELESRGNVRLKTKGDSPFIGRELEHIIYFYFCHTIEGEGEGRRGDMGVKDMYMCHEVCSKNPPL